MTSKDLTRDQLETLAEKARQMTAWLHALQQRMEQQHFPADDELLRVTREAADKIQHLRMVLHYLECDAGKRA